MGRRGWRLARTAIGGRILRRRRLFLVRRWGSVRETSVRERPRSVVGRCVAQGREADGCEGVRLRARMRRVRLGVSALAPILGTRPLRGACVEIRLRSSVLGTRPCPGACDLGYEAVERSVERDGLRLRPRVLRGRSQSDGSV